MSILYSFCTLIIQLATLSILLIICACAFAHACVTLCTNDCLSNVTIKLYKMIFTLQGSPKIHSCT